jgi:CRP-like cAMP-binding protein
MTGAQEQVMEQKRYPKGTVILKDGSDGNEIYIIQTGKVSVYKTIKDEKVRLASLGPDDFFGDMSMFLNNKRTANVEALEDCEVLVGGPDAFLKSIEKDARYAMKIITTLAHRLQNAHDIISEIEGQKRAYEILLTPFDQMENIHKGSGNRQVPEIIKKIRSTMRKDKA